MITFLKIKDSSMKKGLSIILAVAVISLMSNCSDKAIAKEPFPARPSKKMYSAKSSGPSAPVRIKDIVGDQSAKPNATGQQRKKKI
jgi:hypothetical protein